MKLFTLSTMLATAVTVPVGGGEVDATARPAQEQRHGVTRTRRSETGILRGDDADSDAIVCGTSDGGTSVFVICASQHSDGEAVREIGDSALSAVGKHVAFSALHYFRKAGVESESATPTGPEDRGMILEFQRGDREVDLVVPHDGVRLYFVGRGPGFHEAGIALIPHGAIALADWVANGGTLSSHGLTLGLGNRVAPAIVDDEEQLARFCYPKYAKGPVNGKAFWAATSPHEISVLRHAYCNAAALAAERKQVSVFLLASSARARGAGLEWNEPPPAHALILTPAFQKGARHESREELTADATAWKSHVLFCDGLAAIATIAPQ